MECWTLLACAPRVASRDAVEAEKEGWDGVVLADSQNLAAEVLVEMAYCLARTDYLKVAPGVANPVTRHPAVLAGALASLQAESGGRAVLGLGRGDSSLAHIGHAPAPVAVFERYLTALQGYLRGEEVPFDAAFAPAGMTPVDALGLGTAPTGSSLRWLRPSQPKVPVDVAATGPRVIDLAARLADAVTFAVGADPRRIGWAVGRARAARAAAGLDPDGMTFGAYVNIVVHDDVEIAHELVAGGLASTSRFAVMHGSVTGGASGQDVDVLEALHRSYDMNQHGTPAATHNGALGVEFTHRNAIVGPADHCLARLANLRDQGIRRFQFMEPFDRRGQAGKAHQALVRDVVPEVQTW
ncbi:MAG: hypothetical protein ABS81_00765 [Pseudonocardia sp. SCN 72-86]|nr:MAG: hypothetical protein ABS81_00765 [Pseudonocardia sp. SCN 72-86]